MAGRACWRRVVNGPARVNTPDVDQQHVGVVLSCTSCMRTYEPAAEDFATGRAECPDPDCGGWTFWARLLSPGEDRVLAPGPDRGCPR